MKEDDFLKRAIILKAKDNVATLLNDVLVGDEVILLNENNENCGIIEILNPIERGHKAATADIKKGESIIKYGHVIGTASMDIKKGENIHVHNIESNRGRGDLVWK